MSYSQDIYKKYVSAQTRTIRPEQSLMAFRKQFPEFNSYYGAFLPEKKDCAILDVACGNGSLVYWLRGKGYRNARGVDISDEQVAAAHTLGIVNVEKKDLFDELSGKKDAFDVIFAIDIIEHLKKSDAVEFLRQAQQSLRRGGVLIIRTPNGESPFGGRYGYGDFTHETVFTERSLREVFVITGLRPLAFRETGPIAHGFASGVRWILWQGIRILLNLSLVVETGQPARVLTQNIIAIATK
jgi:2-polyprenyl-3-methyl-5-hydroxy-6-metoxy-1,4-benzoquinol methylase